jgi:hypothetical protein
LLGNIYFICTSFAHLNIDNIRTVLGNLYFICTSFRNKKKNESLEIFSVPFRSECKLILYFLRCTYIYNIRTLSVNIKFICTSFRNRQNSEPSASFSGLFRSECLSCNVKIVGKLVRFRQKGQKQASFLAFHKFCQGCLLRGPCYISTSFILVCALRCTMLQGTRKVYS